MSIRDALGAVPAKPIILTAVVFTLVAAGWHGLNLKRTCGYRAGLTAEMHTWAEEALKSRNSRALLKDATSFKWDSVRIVQPTLIEYIKGNNARALNCPFGWYWSEEKRQKMAASGNMTLFGFIKDQRIVEIVEFDNAAAGVSAGTDVISHDNAIFNAGNGTELQLVRQ